MSHQHTIIESLTRRIEARERGEQTGYGERRSLEIEITSRAKPFLAVWHEIETEHPGELPSCVAEELAAIRALLERAEKVMS